MIAAIETYSGISFQPLDPSPNLLDIEDIAHALSQQCRFSGHTRVHYSVAEHSVRVSELLKSWGFSKQVQLWGLLHDASEAYLADIPAPLKAAPEFMGYRIAETELMIAVCDRFGLPHDEPDAVRIADATLLATEARDLMPFNPQHWGDLSQEPLQDEVIEPWSAESAENEFLALFEDLTS